ncbi:MAG: T9SS type A sorting domain-containing protein [Candidatus Zixiibacteriota bacterium]
MSKRVQILSIIMVILVPSLIFSASAHKFAVGKATVAGDNQVVVPLVVTNEANLAAIDIPLKFSEGVTLKEVDFNFEGSRVSHFDLKVANIKNDERTVVIGLLPQLTSAQVPDLEAGTGPVANLVFEVNDPSVTEIKVEAVELKEPNHSLMFVYHDYDAKGTPLIRTESPEFEPVTVALSNTSAPALPKDYALKQNYPNPFNPTTEIAFDLPEPAHVKLTIYNVLGQTVETLMERDMEAGSHTVTWDARKNASGVYFYRITTNNFTDTKKMLLLK